MENYAYAIFQVNDGKRTGDIHWDLRHAKIMDWNYDRLETPFDFQPDIDYIRVEMDADTFLPFDMNEEWINEINKAREKNDYSEMTIKYLPER